MSFDLTSRDVDTLWAEAKRCCPPAVSIDRLETICAMPAELGYGYQRCIDLYPDLELSIFQQAYRQDFTCRGEEHLHVVQFMVHLSGVVDSGGFIYQDATQGYIGGSGIQPAMNHFSLAPTVGR